MEHANESGVQCLFSVCAEMAYGRAVAESNQF